ncbi:glycogen debranching protein GlgX [soil metagenome]
MANRSRPFADRLLAGTPGPLGAHWDGLGINFAVFSANAHRIDLCLFDASGRKELARLTLPERTDEIFHGYLPEAPAGLLYGYRAFGPYDPAHGHRFNPHKLLLDPYARQLSGPLRWSDALFGYRAGSSRGDAVIDRRDSAPAMPKGIVVDESFNWGSDRPPATPWSRSVIYEMHVRGVSKTREQLLPTTRGTFAALADPAFIEHLNRLGVTAVELLPVHALLQDRFLVERGLRNYWGYSTLSFFAPEPDYLSSGTGNEMRVAVRRLHAAGIEVILDVVYNHTCEGSELGPTLSWRGLDNASYYRLMPGDERHYINDTGTGNTVNINHPRVLQMVMDSLRHWVNNYHVDGFRFDLGTILGREASGFDPGSGFFDAILQDPVLSKFKLISEPWDLCPGGYQLGNHPPGVSEWNDKFRDTARCFLRGAAGARADLARRLTGSGDLFDRRGRRPHASVNFITAHDGFTLRDLVSYSIKHNEANKEDNRDGTDDNRSCNWGVEGTTVDPEIETVRERVSRSMLATLLFSAGTPMLLGGDEFRRTQQGNNNAYCQDSDVSWFDWTLAGSVEGERLTAFVSRLVALRAQRPSLRHDRYVHGVHEYANGLHDIDWFDADGDVMTPDAWHDPEGRVLALRRASLHDHSPELIDVTLFIVNAGADGVRVTLPEPVLDWTVLVDSAASEVAGVRPIEAGSVRLEAHSIVLLGTYLDQPPGHEVRA